MVLHSFDMLPQQSLCQYSACLLTGVLHVWQVLSVVGSAKGSPHQAVGWAWLDSAAKRQVGFRSPVGPAAVEIVSLLAWHMTLLTESFTYHRHVLVCIYALCLMALSIYITCSAGCVCTTKLMVTLRLVLPPKKQL